MDVLGSLSNKDPFSLFEMEEEQIVPSEKNSIQWKKLWKGMPEFTQNALNKDD